MAIILICTTNYKVKPETFGTTLVSIALSCTIFELFDV